MRYLLREKDEKQWGKEKKETKRNEKEATKKREKEKKRLLRQM